MPTICRASSFSGTELANQRWSNWSGSIDYRIKKLFKPSNLEDLVWVVAEATDQGRELHAIGSGWAFEDAATSAEWVVSLENLKSELTTVVPAALTAQWRTRQADATQDSLVHVQTGIEIGELNDLLAGRMLAMRTLGGSNGQTLAGAVSTSTHGGDVAMGPLPDQVRALHLVTAGGRELWIERASAPVTTNAPLQAALTCPGVKIIRDDDIFDAAVVSVGRFGVIHAMVLQVTPAFKLAEWTTQPNTTRVIRELKAGVVAASGLAALDAAIASPPTSLTTGRVTSVPHFVQLFFNSQDTSTCFVTRRWRVVGTGLTDLNMAGPSEPMCDSAFAAAIMHGTAALLRNAAAGFMLIPFVGPVWAASALHTAHSLELQSTIGGPLTGGEALARSVNALWVNNLGALVPEIAKLALNNRFNASAAGKRGASNLITSGPLGTGKGKCLLSDSIEIVFSADTDNYIRYLELLLAVAPSYRQSGYISVRYSAPSQALLSMHNSADRMVVSIEVASVKDLQGNGPWMDFVETMARAHDGRPHWGQINHLDEAEVDSLYAGNLVRWREALLTVSGTSTVFSNHYTRQRGLEPTGTLREVTATRKLPDGVITHLCGGAGASWGPVPVGDAIDQIENGSVAYFTNIGGVAAHVNVVDDPQGKYLRSQADETTSNNLDDLPDC